MKKCDEATHTRHIHHHHHNYQFWEVRAKRPVSLPFSIFDRIVLGACVGQKSTDTPNPKNPT